MSKRTKQTKREIDDEVIEVVEKPVKEKKPKKTTSRKVKEEANEVADEVFNEEEAAEPEPEVKPKRKTRKAKAEAVETNDNVSMDNASVDDSNVNSRVRTVKVSRFADNSYDFNQQTQSQNTQVKSTAGKTYKQPVKNQNFYSHETVLNFDFKQCEEELSDSRLNECSVEDILKYLISVTHKEGSTKRALCNVFKNTLTGVCGETNLPLIAEMRSNFRSDAGQQNQRSNGRPNTTQNRGCLSNKYGQNNRENNRGYGRRDQNQKQNDNVQSN